MTDLAFDRIITQPVLIEGARSSEFDVLRLDKIHPIISGNKWFKLKFHFQEAFEQGKKGIVTFGGAYSNHLVATAAACKLKGLESFGIVRGEKPQKLSETLLNCIEYGMQLIFLSREDYRVKKIPTSLDMTRLHIIPEGGYGESGAKGIEEMIRLQDNKYDHYVCAVGTGTMMAGIVNGVESPANVTGISVMKNNQDLHDSISALTNASDRDWSVNHDYHFGGYAKHPKELISYMNRFYTNSRIPLDIIYTGKLFFATEDLAKKGFFADSGKVLIIHSGGLQGNNSLEKGTLIY